MEIARRCFERLIKRLMSGVPMKGEDAKDAHLEVERKYRATDEEFSRLPERARSLNFVEAGQVVMTDTFLPTEDEGDMMRVRVESGNGLPRSILTLKSWVSTADGGKERKETEREIPAFLGRLLVAIGRTLKGSPLMSFSKHRQLFEGNLSGWPCVLSLDRVDKLGPYSGVYLEVEILVPVGTDVTPARQRITAFASELLGENREPFALSYMEMLKRSLQLSRVS
jgi:adenylate cyclase class IV